MNDMTTPPEPEPDPAPSTIYVSAETWDWLQKRLQEPPRANPKLVELMKNARQIVRQVPDEEVPE